MSLINPSSVGLSGAASFLGTARGAAPPTTAPATAAPYSAIYAFGDSLSDAGNDYAASLHLLPSAPYVDGHFTNGAVWVQDLAYLLGLPGPGPSLTGGTDFAFGGAETGATPSHALSPIDLPVQLASFAAEVPHPQPNALYTLWIGANDLLDAVSADATDPATARADVAQAVANERAFVAALAADGARNFLVLDAPDLGKTPTEIAAGPAAASNASALSALFNSELGTALQAQAAASGLDLHIVDTYGLIDQATADPAAFGLTNVTQPVWTGSYTDPRSGVLNATGAAQNQYLFWDSLHPTAQVHAILANVAYNTLFPAA